MEDNSRRLEKPVLSDRTDCLIAIGAAVAANCIPCFEHIYEKAIAAGIPATEIKRVSKIAAMVKKGAHTAIADSIDELVGDGGDAIGSPCSPAADNSCCC